MKIKVPYDFEPREEQKALWSYMQKGGFQKKRAVGVWHRRCGKDLNGINLINTAQVQRPGLYWHLFPFYNQGRKIAWDGMTKMGRRFIDHFNPELVSGKNNTDMRITFHTGSIYQVVGADKPDSLVGANPVGIIFSEWSIMSPKIWDLIQPILAENDGWALFIYTPRGKNHGWTKLQEALTNPNWFGQILRNSDTHYISDEAVEEMRKSGMSEEMIAQEIECSFDAPVPGSYYGKLMTKALSDGRIGNVPWEPRLPVHTAWDLGVGDSTSIWFVQIYGQEVRVIDYYENSGEGFPHYAKVLQDRGYLYGSHFAPHDIEVKELGSGKTRIQTAKELGIRFNVVKQHSIEDGIEAARSLIPICWFDKTKCDFGIQVLNQYHKEYDDINMVFKNKPEHDWSSHGADAFRYLAMGLKVRSKFSKAPQQTAISDYNPFGQ